MLRSHKSVRNPTGSPAMWERATSLKSALPTIRSMFFAAAHPERVSSLVLIEGFARILRDDDYPAWEAFVYSLCCYALVGVVWNYAVSATLVWRAR